MKPEVLLQLIHDLQAQISQLRQANSVLQQQLAVAQEAVAKKNMADYVVLDDKDHRAPAGTNGAH